MSFLWSISALCISVQVLLLSFLPTQFPRILLIPCVKKNLSFCMVCLQRTYNFARRKKPLKLVCQSEFFTSCQSALIASAYVTQLKVKFCLPGQQPDSWCFWAISEMNPLFWSFVVRMNPIGMTCKVQMMIAKLVYSDILGQSKLVQSWAATKYKRENEE